MRPWRLALALLILATALLPGVALAASEGTNAGRIFGTGGAGVWLKAEARLDSARIVLLTEGTGLHLLQGPLRAGNDLWWARIESGGQEGWIVAEYLLMDTAPTPTTATTPTPIPDAAPPTLAPGGWAKVINTYTTTGLRLRGAAAPWAELLAILPEGSAVQIVAGPQPGGNGNQWYNVSAEGKIGWVDSTYLEPTTAPDNAPPAPAVPAPSPLASPSTTPTPTPTPAASPSTTPTPLPPTATVGLATGIWAIVTDTTGTTGLRLRAAPAPWEQLLAILPEGTSLKILEGPANGGNGNAWYRVAWDGSWGWVDGTYLTPATAPIGGDVGAVPVSAPTNGTTSGNALVQVALAQVGKKYVWGATGPDTFDCSGLTVYVARTALGITLPRVAAAQAFAGVHVEPADLAPGDLLFYANTYQPGITHVGVYIGNGHWVNAADEASGVIISSMGEPYWKARYAGARRIT